MDDKKRLQYKWLSAIPIICVIVYFILAFCLERFAPSVNHPYLLSLLVFLIIPFDYVIVGLKKLKLEYPGIIILVYIVIGIVSQVLDYPLWHPAWVLFLTIPIYYIFKDKNYR